MLIRSDRAYKYFFISENCDKLLNEDQKAFLRMVTGGKASNKFTGQVENLLEDAKRNAQWRKQYMEWEREKTYIREDAMEQKAVEAARNFLAMNVLTPEQIAQGTGLPLEQVLELQKELAAAPAN